MDAAHDHRSFDERARDWDAPETVQRARLVAAAIRAAVTVDDATRLLEYGAGTGLAAQHLGPVGPVTLADPSAGMREVMADKVAAGTLPDDARIVDVDLGRDVGRFRGAFDLIVTVMALHHVPDPPAVLAGFAAALDAGGTVCIVDLDAEDGSFHSDTAFDVHHGFDREDLSALLAAAGFDGIRFATLTSIDREDGSYPVFIAFARLAARP